MMLKAPFDLSPVQPDPRYRVIEYHRVRVIDRKTGKPVWDNLDTPVNRARALTVADMNNRHDYTYQDVPELTKNQRRIRSICQEG